MSDFLPFETGSSVTECFQPYLRGPCEEGDQFVPDKEGRALEEDAGHVSAGCQKFDCPAGQIMWSNEECVTEIPDCILRVTYNPEGKFLVCDINIRQLLILPESCPDGYSLNHEGVCKKVSFEGLFVVRVSTYP